MASESGSTIQADLDKTGNDIADKGDRGYCQGIRKLCFNMVIMVIIAPRRHNSGVRDRGSNDRYNSPARQAEIDMINNSGSGQCHHNWQQDAKGTPGRCRWRRTSQ